MKQGPIVEEMGMEPFIHRFDRFQAKGDHAADDGIDRSIESCIRKKQQ